MPNDVNIQEQGEQQTLATKVTTTAMQPRGSTSAVGRKAALACLDSMIIDDQNMQMLRESLQDRFNLDPSQFFKEIIMPLLPRETNLQADAGGTQINIVMVEAPESDSSVVVAPATVADVGKEPIKVETFASVSA